MRDARSHIGLSMSFMQYLETDQMFPGPATLEKLSAGYGVPIDELATSEERQAAEEDWQETLDYLLGPDSYLSEADKDYYRRTYRPEGDSRD